MPGTRTAPDATTSANKIVTTLHLIDASGDQFSASYITGTVPTASEVEAWAVAYQAATQASLWKISQSSEWVGEKETNNATSNIRYQVDNGINLLFRASDLLSSFTLRLVAPVTATMDGSDDIPLPGVVPLSTLNSATATVTGGTFESAQYSTRRERKNNPRRGT